MDYFHVLSDRVYKKPESRAGKCGTALGDSWKAACGMNVIYHLSMPSSEVPLTDAI